MKKRVSTSNRVKLIPHQYCVNILEILVQTNAKKVGPRRLVSAKPKGRSIPNLMEIQIDLHQSPACIDIADFCYMIVPSANIILEERIFFLLKKLGIVV